MEYFLVTDDHCENLEGTIWERALSVGKLPGRSEGACQPCIIHTADVSSTGSTLARGLGVEWWSW